MLFNIFTDGVTVEGYIIGEFMHVLKGRGHTLTAHNNAPIKRQIYYREQDDLL